MRFAEIVREKAKPLLLALLVGILALSGQADLLSSITGALTDKDSLLRWAGMISGATRQAVPVLVIDVDDETLARLGNPDRTPRDTLADLIRLAAAKKPLGVFVDLDTSRAGASPEADRMLQTFVADYPPDAPFLSFARRFVEAKTGEKASALGLAPLPSLLDAAAVSKPNVMLLASLTQRDSDRVIRRWQLSQTICDGKSGVNFASPHLLAAALQTHGKMGDGKSPRNALDAYAHIQVQQLCAKNSTPKTAWPRNPDHNATIWYLFDGEGETSVRTLVHDGREMPIIQKMSARRLLDAQGKVLDATKIADALFAGRFIVIGSSHLESYDQHVTPLGPMPGSLIVANAIATAPATLNAPHLPVFVRILGALGLFIGIAALTLRLRSLVAGFVAGGLLLITLSLLGQVLAPSTAIEIVLSALAMLALFAGIESLYEIIAGWRGGKGWRALLKPSAQAKDEAT